MNIRPFSFPALLAAILVSAAGSAGAGVASFDDLSLAANSAYQGPLGSPLPPDYALVQGTYGPVAAGSFSSGGVAFANRRDQTYGSWSGFAYSNQTDATTEGWTNQFSTYAGAAHSGSNFAVAAGYHDLTANALEPEAFNPLDLDHLEGLPHFTLPTDAIIQGMRVTNTTYAALSLLRGDSYAAPLGGTSGTVPDWYKLTAYGTDAAGDVLVDSGGSALFVELYLADNRQGQMFIADQWMEMDLSLLAGAHRLYFNVSGTIGDSTYGLATPSYFAVDDVTFDVPAPAVPEPSSLAMAATAAALVGLAARRRRRA